MSIPFNDTTNLNGLVQFYENELGLQYGDISGNTTLLKEFTAKVNLALDKYFAIAIQASGTWELDDNNHTDYPIIYTNLVSGQRDYPFTVDGNGHAILDIYKVLVLPSATATLYQELDPVDENDEEYASIIDESNASGIPSVYGKRANAIFFDTSPNYNATNGVKMLVNRESTRFTVNDTTKVVGYPYHQEYFFLKPAYDYARVKGLSSFPRLQAEILKLEGDPDQGIVGLIKKAYGNRRRDEENVVSGECINSV